MNHRLFSFVSLFLVLAVLSALVPTHLSPVDTQEVPA